MFLVNLDCFDIQKFETNVEQAYFTKFYLNFILFISSAVTPLQSVFLVFKDEYLFALASGPYVVMCYALLNPLVLQNQRLVRI